MVSSLISFGGDYMPSAVPQILWIEAGSLLLWALPGPTPGSTQQRCHCKASQVIRICPSSPMTASTGPRWTSLFRNVRKTWCCVVSSNTPWNNPPLTWYTFILISDTLLGGSICVLEIGSPNSSSVPLLSDCGLPGQVQDIHTRITKTWVFHTFKITVFAFTDLGP